MTSSFLIVDEDRNFREALAIALRLDGHEAAVAATSEEGCTRLRERRFTCCVVDVHLIGADAVLETAAASDARAVATGPYAEILAAVSARHRHAAVLAKPFHAFDLSRLLERPTRAAG